MSLFGKNPNGLSINTGGGAAAGGSSLFGGSSSSQPQQQGTGLFGSTTTTSQPSQGTSLFGSMASTSQPQQGGGVFGSGTTASQPQQTSGLFGLAKSQPQQSGGLFGSLSTSQPQQSGGLLGSLSTSQPQQSGGLLGSLSTSQPQQSGGLFGSSTTSQPQQSGGLFGSSATSQPQQGSSLSGSTLLGGSNQSLNAQPQSGTSLFGNQSNQSQGQSGSLFSGLGQKPSQPQQTSSVFGGTSGFGQQQQSQPQQTSTGLFGSLGQSQQQSQPQQTSSGLFGSLGQPQQQSQPQQNTSVFGGSTFGQSQPQPQQNTSLFGNSAFGQSQTQPQQPQLQSSIYGNLGPQGRAATASLFGSSTAQRPSQSLFPGPLTMGQSGSSSTQPTQQSSGGAHQAPTTVPGVTIDLSQIRGTTRFNDLHTDLQGSIEKIDGFIARQMSYAEQCAQMLPAHADALAYIPNDVAFVAGRVDTVETGLDNDAREMAALRTAVHADGDDAKRAFRALENLKLPLQFHYGGIWHQSRYATNPAAAHAHSHSGVDAAEEAAASTDLVAYFGNVVGEMERLFERYTGNMREIEEHLKTVEQGAIRQTKELMARKGREKNGEEKEGGNHKEDNLRELATVLKEFENGILHVASHVGDCKEQVQELMLGAGNGWGSGRNGFAGSVGGNGWGRLSGY